MSEQGVENDFDRFPRSKTQISDNLRRTLEKLDEERLQRNRNRAHKCTQGNGDTVSEDKEDTISPLLMAEEEEHLTEEITDEERYEIGSENETLKESVTKAKGENTGNRGLLFADEKAKFQTFEAYDTSIPKDIDVLASCKHSPPLYLFTTQSLKRLRNRIGIKTVKIGTGPHENTRIIDINEFPGDESMDQAMWSLAYNNFLNWMAQVAGKEVLGGFAAHHDAMLADPDFTEWFPAYRSFDKKIRSQFFSRSFIIDPKSHAWATALQNAKSLSIRQTPTSKPFQMYLSALLTDQSVKFLMTSPFEQRALSNHSAYVAEAETVTELPIAMPSIPANANAPGLLPGRMALLPVSQTVKQSASDLTSLHAPLTMPITHSTPVPCVTTLITLRPGALETDFERVITPYHAEEWYKALCEANLLQKYPNLIFDIKRGSPIGNPPRLDYTFIPPNMPSALKHPELVEEHFTEEIKSGRMSGPYTIDQAHIFFKGHFRCAPIGFIEKEPGSKKWRMIRNLSACDDYGFSTNSWLNAKDMSIMWHSCSVFADLVCSFLLSKYCMFFPVECLL